MNTPFYHNILEERRNFSIAKRFDEIYNGFVIEDPTDAIDCSPESGFDNFQRLLGGDKLVYCELANSTPFDGFKVKREFYELARKNARTSCVFSGTDIKKMSKSVVGTKVVKHHDYALWKHDGNEIGVVIDTSILNGQFNDKKFKTLCILCWIDGREVEKAILQRNNLLYLSFGMHIANETCCQCGRTSSVGSPCNHVKYNSVVSALSICAFEKFTEIELGHIKECRNEQ